MFKVTFYYSQPFHKLPHSWELEAQAGDNCDGQRTIGPEKKSISLFHWRSDIRMTFVGKKETWISTSISDQTGTFAWIEFPSKVRIWFCISESTVLLLILNKYNKQQKGIYTVYTRYNVYTVNERWIVVYLGLKFPWIILGFSNVEVLQASSRGSCRDVAVQSLIISRHIFMTYHISLSLNLS